jgi:hypothetical protein
MAGHERKGSAQSAWQLLGFDQDGRSLTYNANVQPSFRLAFIMHVLGLGAGSVASGLLPFTADE